MLQVNLLRARNGGWLLTTPHGDDSMPCGPLAAYSSTEDMLNGLSKMLEAADECSKNLDLRGKPREK